MRSCSKKVQESYNGTIHDTDTTTYSSFVWDESGMSKKFFLVLLSYISIEIRIFITIESL